MKLTNPAGIVLALTFVCFSGPAAGAAPPFSVNATQGLGPHEGQGSLYLIYGPPDRMNPLPGGVEHLGQWRGGALLRGTPTAMEALAVRGFELILLDGSEVELAGTERAPSLPVPRPPLGVDPDIAQILLAMSSAQMTANIQRLQDFRTRYSYSDSCLAAGYYIRDRFQALGFETTLDPFTFNTYTINNVIGEKTGVERPGEIYIICGHYDSISNQSWNDAPGADDNASGTAAVLEAARVLAPIPFEATIRFIAFAGEEQGLVGSRHYVEQHIIPQQEDLRAVINLDMIAFVHPNYPEWDANWYGDIPVSGDLAELVGQCVQEYTTCVLHLTLDPEPTYGSDHYWFAGYGYPAVFGIDAQLWNAPDWDPYYHTVNDRLNTLDPPFATELARGAVAALATLAVPAEGTAVLEPVTPSGSLRLAVGPNPFRASATFEVGAERVGVRITDAQGRLVTEFAGSGRLVWPARDAAGRLLPAGVYFYTVRAGTKEVSGRLVRVR
jgi:hypothetical protein